MPSGQFKTSYRDDTKIFQTVWVKVWLALLFVFLLVFPFFAGKYLLYLANLVGIAVIGVLGLNILSGFTGQISLGHSAFLALGAYASTLFTLRLGIPFWLSMPLAGLFSSLCGMLLALPCLKLRGLYLAIATFAFYFIVEYAIVHWDGLTNGTGGLTVADPSVLGIAIDSDTKIYFLILVLVVLGLVFAKNLFRTETGRAFIAVRDNDIAAEIIGINVARYKVLAFMICSFYAGVAGSLYAITLSFIGPEHFTFLMTIEYLAMGLVGGIGTIAGSVFGALFMTALPEAIRLLRDALSSHYPFLVSRLSDLQSGLYGLVIILFLIFEPTGLFGLWLRVKKYWLAWPYSYR
jgi:branched-chain amino acid transport system permease protein